MTGKPHFGEDARSRLSLPRAGRSSRDHCGDRAHAHVFRACGPPFSPSPRVAARQQPVANEPGNDVAGDGMRGCARRFAAYLVVARLPVPWDTSCRGSRRPLFDVTIG
jgi:hypothetical protein